MGSKMVVANLKMAMDAKTINSYLKVLDNSNLNKNVVICPTNIYIPYFLNKTYSVGIQNIHAGVSVTGEVSATQSKSLGIDYVIIGHSERRTFLDESDELINLKIREALKSNMKVIFCVGEDANDRGKLDIIKRQLINGLYGISKDCFQNIYIAYEPVWAIGTSVGASTDEINYVINYIKRVILDNFGIDHIRIIYGGGINIDNIKKIIIDCPIDGVLLGSVSTQINEFLNVIEVVVDQ